MGLKRYRVGKTIFRLSDDHARRLGVYREEEEPEVASTKERAPTEGDKPSAPRTRKRPSPRSRGQAPRSK